MSKSFNINNLSKENTKEIANLLKNGKIGILPTDTIYGIHGVALNSDVVERIYDLKRRDQKKPMIILISKIEQMQLFSTNISKKIETFLRNNWPNKLSVILDCPNPTFNYLHRGTNTLAFRMPNHKTLLRILNETGPLVSTSANLHMQKPASTLNETKDFFNNLDFYVDGGTLQSLPSTVVKIEDNSVKIIRQGTIEIIKSPLHPKPIT